jgi:Ca2+-transporting ATPase
MIRRLILLGGTASALALGFFWWRTASGVPFPQVQTETFTLVAMCQWFNVLNCRSETASALKFSAFTNKWLIGGLILGVILQFLVIYTPALGRIFHTTPLTLASVLLVAAISSGVLWAEEIRKAIARSKKGRPAARSDSPESRE